MLPYCRERTQFGKPIGEFQVGGNSQAGCLGYLAKRCHQVAL